MKLIIGLGNPGDKYANSRHNIGFWLIDQFAKQHSLEFQFKAKFKAFVAVLEGDNGKVILVKPSTYYNRVGESARALMDYYKLSAQDLLIIHDELALPVGTVRTRLGGSNAGNNGIKSINQQVGTSTYRIRVGVGSSLRDQVDDADFVLNPLNATEKQQITDQLPVIFQAINDFIAEQSSATTYRQNQA